MGTISPQAADAIFDDMAGEPTVPELLQEENKNSFVMPVEQHGPVQVQLLPAQSSSAVTRTLDAITPVPMLGSDLRRSRAVLISTAGAVWIGDDSGSVLGRGQGSILWPAGVPFEIKTSSPVWVMADTGTATVSVYAEFWTN